MALAVDKFGVLTVRAPRRVDLNIVARFINEKRAWIEKQVQKSREVRSSRKNFSEGELFWFLGRQYPLTIQTDYGSRLLFDQSNFILSKFQRHKAEALFERWYRKQARLTMLSRTEYWAGQMGLKFSKITITGANTRWGSCSRSGSINFTWRLVMAPEEVIDYVIIHELAHLVHHNHSQKFWALVAAYCPSFSELRLWLRKQGHVLTLS